VRWLIVKDLQILRRSPLLVGLLIAYPIAIAVLVGLALSKGPDKPKVAVLNDLPASQRIVDLGGERIDLARYARLLNASVDTVAVSTRAQALAKVRSGEALAALIIPADIASKLAAGGLDQSRIEVVYNVEDPVKARFVESTINARVADANLALSRKFSQVAAQYIRLLLDGGRFNVLGSDFNVLGLRNAKTILDGTLAGLPAGASARVGLQQVDRFAGLAIDNLGLSDRFLASVSRPIAVKRTVAAGRRTPLDEFAVAVSVTLSLMLVTVLLAAGLLALEREEHAFGRLVRGLVSRLALLGAKVGLAAACAVVVSGLMLAGIGAFVTLDWSRAPLWLLALAAGACAFAALGVAIGGLAREVRAASLLALLLSLPVAFLALVPSGSVSAGLYDVVRVVSAAFPFKPALDALAAALSGGGMVAPLAHLAILTLAFGAIARLALRRLA